jgi:hypothetical protein
MITFGLDLGTQTELITNFLRAQSVGGLSDGSAFAAMKPWWLSVGQISGGDTSRETAVVRDLHKIGPRQECAAWAPMRRMANSYFIPIYCAYFK